MLAAGAALLALLAAVGSAAGTVGGFAEFFAVLTGAGLTAALGVASGRPMLERVAAMVAVGWDVAVGYALFLLAFFRELGTSSPPAGPPQLFLGVPLVFWHVLGAYGGAVLVTLAVLRRPPARRREAGVSR